MLVWRFLLAEYVHYLRCVVLLNDIVTVVSSMLVSFLIQVIILCGCVVYVDGLRPATADKQQYLQEKCGIPV